MTQHDATGWKSQLSSGIAIGELRSRLRLWLAEFELAGKEEPEAATKLFRQLRDELPLDSPIKGIAWRGLGLALHFSGRYAQAAEELKGLLKSRAIGFNRRTTATLARHSASCAGNHLQRQRAGITVPTHLDPLCGASSLAIALRHLGKPHGKSLMKSTTRFTGFGSNMNDLLIAAEKHGLVAVCLTTGDEGLQAILKASGGIPVITRVEHDHFVAVTRADSKGVAYWCSDCGPWPGGEKSLTWQQWRLMEADGFVAVAEPKSEFGRALAMLRLSSGQFQGTLWASIQSTGQVITGAQQILNILQTAGVANFALPWLLICGLPPQSVPCKESDCEVEQPCPTAGPPRVAYTEDPVNLATGAETYHPGPVMRVYNPIGPSVAWGHAYNSMANPIPNGYGTGWYHPYLWTIKFRVGGTPSDPVGDPPGGGGGGGAGAQGGGGQAMSFGGGFSSGYIIHPNSAQSWFTFGTDTPPDSSNPVHMAPFDFGESRYIEWKYDALAPGGSYLVVTNKDRSKMEFSQLGTLPNPNLERYYYLSKITDRMGNWISLDWAGPYSFRSYNIFQGNTYQGFALSTIRDMNGSPLLTLGYGAQYGRIVSANDRYNRSVYYTVANFANENVPFGHPQDHDELTQVSQLVSTGTSNPPILNQYEYQNHTNWEGIETVPYLWQIKKVGPTGSGFSTATITYNSLGYVSSLQDASGNKTLLIEMPGNETKVSHRTSTNQVVEEYTVGWNASMNTSYLKNANGQTVWSAYYADPSTPHRPSSITDGNNRTWTFNWDSYNNLLSSTTPKSTTTTNTIDYSNFQLGEVTQTQEGAKTSASATYYQPSGLVNTISTPIPGQSGTGNTQSTTYTYDSLGNLTSIVEPGNNAAGTKTTTLNYTTDGGYTQAAAIGQPVAITDPLGKVWHYRYNPRGTVQSAWDPLGHTFAATYNIVDQLAETFAPPTGTSGPGSSRQQSIVGYPGGPVLQANAFDEAGVLFRQVNFGYGGEGQLLTRTGAGESVTLTYDAAYKVKTLKDGNNGTPTTYTYNTKGQATQIDYPLASGFSFDRVKFTSYDVVGNLLTRIDGRNITTNYVYGDADGYLTQVNYPAYPGQNLAVAYDAYGRAGSVTDGTGASTASYDDLDGVTSSTRTYSGIAAKTFNYTYYPDGSRATMVNPAGSWSYYYDVNSRPTSMTSPAGTMTWLHLDNGWLSKRTLPNGTYTDYAFNPAGALTSLANKTSGGFVLSSYGSFLYDGVFNLKGLTASVPGAPTQGGATTWNYDTKDRLTQEASARSGGYTQNFGYDAAGNPTTWKGSAQTFNADNQRTTSGFTYDGNGNPANYAGTALTFDPENRLTGFGATWTASYRADGLRAKKSVSGTSTYFLYDGGFPVAEMNASGTITATNVYAPDGLAARQQAGSWIYYAFDQQGNVSQRLNSAQTVLSSSVYDAYGVETSSGSPNDPFGYNAQSGYNFDRETGLYACMFRYYDPARGRWLNRDPISYAGGLNLYGYCGSGPVGWADSTGEGPAGVIIRKVILGGRKVRKGRVNVSQAIEIRKRGGNLEVSGNSRRGVRRTAKQIEDGVPGKTIHHGTGDHPQPTDPLPHYQTQGRSGHTFYRLPGFTLPLSDLGDRVGGFLGECIDWVNPLSDIQGMYDLAREFFGFTGLGDPYESWPKGIGLPFPGTKVASSPWYSPILH